MKKIAKLSVFAWTALALPLFSLVSCQDQLTNEPAPRGKGARMGVETGLTATQVVVNSPDHTLLEAAVIRAGLAEALSGGTLTVFAPTDAAFRQLGYTSVDAINNADVNALRKILLYHVIGGYSFEADKFQEARVGYTTLEGHQFIVTRSGGNVSVNGVRVTQGNILTTNGVVHVIDQVLLPAKGNIVEVVADDANLTYLVAAVQRASQGGVDVQRILGTTPGLTLFAPTNQAFMAAGFPTIESIRAADPAALTNILTYHVVALSAPFFSTNLSSGQVPTANGKQVMVTVGAGPYGVTVKGSSNAEASNVIVPDKNALNGAVHIIDRVLLP